VYLVLIESKGLTYMRSFLVQASSVEKAIEKGWTEAGSPTEFTVKIHEFGEKGFLGITKKQAIISIIYEPQKQTTLAAQPSQQQKPQPRPYDGESRRPYPQQPKRHPQRGQGAQFSHKQHPEQRQTPTNVSPTHVSTTPVSTTQVSTTQVSTTPSAMPQGEIVFWSDAFINDVSEWLTDLVKIMNFSVSFNVKVNKKNLSLIFNRNLLENKDEERLLFSGLSYLLVQSLKKKYKKKFQGYRLILSSKDTNPSTDFSKTDTGTTNTLTQDGNQE
jgi:predicted RNA-binding protein Jag